VLDPLPVQHNIDVINMAALPNQANSALLREMCENKELSDPYRVLYPTKRDYSYTPFGDIRKNRSRLDFFLISNNLIPALEQCSISPSVLCAQFDHKNISVSINCKPANTTKKKKLTNCFLNSRYLGLSVTTAAIEVYITAIDTTFNENPMQPANFANTADFITDLKRQLTSLKKTLTELENLELQKARSVDDNYLDMLVSAKIATASLAIENMLTLLTLGSFTKRCSHSRFFEVLVEHTKKAGMKAQKKLAYHEKIRKEEIKSQIELLKTDYTGNQEQIFRLECTLRLIIDSEIRSKLSEIKCFECLHAEKATAHFLNIAKKTSRNTSLNDIKDPNGIDFANGNERNDHVTNFYSSLNRKDETVEGEIEDFLGLDICAHPVVSGSKLTEAERAQLDAPLRVEELDVALNKANVKSAPGVDGISYRYIIRFWDIYRQALFECARESFETGVMPDAFRTASIRLIPKKGDVTHIKNWRPISLLSNFYKIISRPINNRLKKVTDRVLSRSQKGFNQSRQIQEVIINSMETMDYCRRHNIRGAMVSVDVSKAFNSLDHGYMEKVYQFFGFGPQIRKWLATIGTGRNAQILLANDELSVAFQLEKGHAQGDAPSPLLYNMAAKICIWKVELDPGIKSVYDPDLRAEPDLNPRERDPDPEPGRIVAPEVFGNEANRETCKNESFADDANNFTVLTFESLNRLKQILQEFKYSVVLVAT
jgi:hypothetical protein